MKEHTIINERYLKKFMSNLAIVKNLGITKIFTFIVKVKSKFNLEAGLLQNRSIHHTLYQQKTHLRN